MDKKVVKILKCMQISNRLKMVSSGDIVAIAGFKTVITGDTLCSMNHSFYIFKFYWLSSSSNSNCTEPQTKIDQEKIVQFWINLF